MSYDTLLGESPNQIRRIKPPVYIGHSYPPLPRHFYMKSYSEHAVALYAIFKSALGLDPKIPGPPKLSPDWERRIFEMCALESPEMCTVLVLVARRVHVWE